MKGLRYIVCLVLCSLFFVPTRATELTVEQNQQFTYYWYAAKEAFMAERYDEAVVLLHFCEQLNPHDGATLEALGLIFHALNQKDSALVMWRRAFEATPRDRWAKYSAALLETGNKADRKQALRVMEKAYALQHKQNKSAMDEDLLEQLRRLYLSEGKYKKSLQMQEDLDRINGYDAYSAYNRTRTYMIWDKPKKALAELDRFLEQEPTNLQFLLYRMDIMERMGSKPKDLYAMYERILELSPYHLAVLNNYAYLLATNKGDLKKAERMSQLTIREEPNNPLYLDTYGWILHLQGQDDLALVYIQKAYNHAEGEARDIILKHAAAVTRAKEAKKK